MITLVLCLDAQQCVLKGPGVFCRPVILGTNGHRAACCSQQICHCGLGSISGMEVFQIWSCASNSDYMPYDVAASNDYMPFDVADYPSWHRNSSLLSKPSKPHVLKRIFRLMAGDLLRGATMWTQQTSKSELLPHMSFCACFGINKPQACLFVRMEQEVAHYSRVHLQHMIAFDRCQSRESAL